MPLESVLTKTSDAFSPCVSGFQLPASDNTSSGLKCLREVNLAMRSLPWPTPFDTTTHVVRAGDARDLAWIQDASIHLIVTSPPYWTLKQYRTHPDQLGAIADYEGFLEQLDVAWAECARVLA